MFKKNAYILLHKWKLDNLKILDKSGLPDDRMCQIYSVITQDSNYENNFLIRFYNDNIQMINLEGIERLLTKDEIKEFKIKQDSNKFGI